MQHTTYFISSLIELNDWLENAQYSQLFVLVDGNTERDCWPKLRAECRQLADASLIAVESGEESKDLEICQGIWSTLLEANADRNALLINLGGGVVTDLGGFVAACYKRGIDFVHIPTSVLAMVDAAIGGKTGVNFGGLKNMIGAFAPPTALFIYSKFASTLPRNEWMSGMAECIKHALIADLALWRTLSGSPDLEKTLDDTVLKQACQVKLDVVKEDPKEKGLRKTLNFGHTTGHALESLSHQSDQPLLHGEAVVLGMIMALALSEKINDLNAQQSKEAIAQLRKWYPHLSLDAFSPEKTWELMLHDKKNENGEVLFVLLDKIGKASWNHPIDWTTWSQVFHELKAH